MDLLRKSALLAAAMLVMLAPNPAPAQVKGGERESQVSHEPTESGGGAYARKPRERARGLSGRATWGKDGAIRIVLLRWPQPGERRDLSMKVRVMNEGSEDFVLQTSDEWAVRTEKAARIVAAWRRDSPEETSVIPPYNAAEISLHLQDRPRHAIVALEYRSTQLEQLVEVKVPYLEATPKLTAPPALPVAALSDPAERRVRVSAVVGANGRPEEIFVLSPPAGTDKYGLRDAAAQAIRTWVFEPALENSVPQQGLVEQTFVFTNRVATRAQLPVPLPGAFEKLSRILRETYPGVRTLRVAKGFVVNEGVRAGAPGMARAFLLRLGEQAPGKSTWASVVAMALQRRQTAAGCECTEWAAQPQAAEEFLRQVASRLGVEVTEIVHFVPQGETIVPSGSAEEESAGRWRQDTIRNMLLAELRDAATETPPGAKPPRTDMPTEDEFTKPFEPYLVAGDVRPPEKLSSAPVVYPAAARQARVQGKVILETIIDANGDVTDVKVLRSVPELDESAKDAVCCWKYRPATIGGKAVPVYFTVVVEFKL